MPVSVDDRISILKVAMRTKNKAAVIGIALARLEGGYGCMSCGAYVGKEPVKPPAVGSPDWDELAEYHIAKCEWIKTQGYQITKSKKRAK